MPMARSASHAAHSLYKGEGRVRNQEDLLDHWPTTKIGQKGRELLASVQLELQTVTGLVRHVADQWLETGSRLGSDVTILAPHSIGEGQLQFQVKKENVLVGGDLVRRIYFYSFIAQEDDMEAHATAAVMGYLFHLCLDIHAVDNPLDPDKTQELLDVAHAIRDRFEGWKERFCVLKAMIKDLAQKHRKKRTELRRDSRLMQHRHNEHLLMGTTHAAGERPMPAQLPAPGFGQGPLPHHAGRALGPHNHRSGPGPGSQGSQGGVTAKAEEQSPWDEEDPSLHPLTFFPSGTTADTRGAPAGAQAGASPGTWAGAAAGAGAADAGAAGETGSDGSVGHGSARGGAREGGVDLRLGLKGEPGGGPECDTWPDCPRDLSQGRGGQAGVPHSHAQPSGIGTPHAHGTPQGMPEAARGHASGTNAPRAYGAGASDPGYCSGRGAPELHPGTSGVPQGTPPGAPDASGVPQGNGGGIPGVAGTTPTPGKFSMIHSLSAKRTAGQAAGVEGGAGWGTPCRGRGRGRGIKRGRCGERREGMGQRRVGGRGAGPVLVAGRGGPMSRILGAVGDLAGPGIEEEDVEVC